MCLILLTLTKAKNKLKYAYNYTRLFWLIYNWNNETNIKVVQILYVKLISLPHFVLESESGINFCSNSIKYDFFLHPT